MAQLEIKKMKQGMSYSCKEKTIILNVFKYFRNQHPEKCITELVRRTANATGCSEKSVFQFRKEESSVEGFKVPSKTKIRKNININSRDIKYDNSVRNSIRNIIYDLQFKNIVPSLNTILKQINNDVALPTFSLMTLRRLMFDMGFSYQKNGNKSVLVENLDPRFFNVDNERNTNEIQPKIVIPQHIPAFNNSQDNLQMPNMPKIPPPMPPDPRLTPLTPVIHKPINMPMPPPPQHNTMMMSHNEILHSNSHPMLHKTMPPMMMNHHREMMPPPIGQGHHFLSAPHGVVKQGP